MTDVFDTLQIYLGSLYVNDFNRFGRTYSVRVQADARLPQRSRTISAGSKVRSSNGAMVPLSALMKVDADGRAGAGRSATTASSSADINGGPAPGYSSGRGAGGGGARLRPRRCRRASASNGPT